jgi:hypothetical protein
MTARTDKKKAAQQQHHQQHRRHKARVKKSISAFAVTHPHAAGIDIGSKTHWVCVGYTANADDNTSLREFSAYTDGLRAIVAFLLEHGVTRVAMESTGIYWIPLFELAGRGRLRGFSG